ncbi:hypothetical protein N9J36_02795 [Litoricola sp.]|nr:hypothetical protein [Litorivicinus sp.]
MKSDQLAPIVVIIFNRPDLAHRLFNAIVGQSGRCLYVISDGPRDGFPSDVAKVEASRRVFEKWPGRLVTNYSSKNLGCRRRIISGLDWVFEVENSAIILEDDCIPSTQFFEYNDYLLNKYLTHQNIFSVCASNPLKVEFEASDQIFLSKYHFCWGWATWRRAWRQVDFDIVEKNLVALLIQLYPRLDSFRAALYWTYISFLLKKRKIDSWAYPFSIYCLINNYRHIIPNFNLVSNLGLRKDASNTRYRGYGLSEIIVPENINLQNNSSVPKPSSYLDKMIESRIYSKSLRYRIGWLLSFLVKF